MGALPAQLNRQPDPDHVVHVAEMTRGDKANGKITAVDAPSLTALRPPWVVFTYENDLWLTGELSELMERGGLVFRLDGRELTQPIALFRTFARELSFADYFGHNWDALADCLHDWHGPGHGEQDVAVVIDDADGLLGAYFLGLFVSVLCQAAWQANLRLDADGMVDATRPRFALHFVFALRQTPPASFTEAVRTGRDVVTSLSGGRLTATLAGEDWPGAPPSSRCS